MGWWELCLFTLVLCINTGFMPTYASIRGKLTTSDDKIWNRKSNARDGSGRTVPKQVPVRAHQPPACSKSDKSTGGHLRTNNNLEFSVREKSEDPLECARYVGGSCAGLLGLLHVIEISWCVMILSWLIFVTLGLTRWIGFEVYIWGGWIEQVMMETGMGETQVVENENILSFCTVVWTLNACGQRSKRGFAAVFWEPGLPRLLREKQRGGIIE